MSSNSGAPARDLEVRSLFPTPLVIARVPLTDDENARLKATILAREAEDKGVTHSNLLGWQSGDDFAAWGGTEGEAVIAFARSLTDQLTANRMSQRVAVEWFVNAWAGINRAGHCNQMHAHPGAVWSGCYYVDDGGCGEDAAKGGGFEVMDPRGLAPAMYAPELVPALSGCQTMGGSDVIQPRSGTMFLFPAWLMHGVRPYIGDGTRICVAFNFALPTGDATGETNG